MNVVDWTAYRKCPACHAALGEQCTNLTGTVADGRAVDARDVPADRPHSRRQLRAGYGR